MESVFKIPKVTISMEPIEKTQFKIVFNIKINMSILWNILQIF